ncbi:RICIN domain-containing protein [Saccharothrix xinjiangensis]|uniref:RICIN domain-containing protein n=1 Tax=Saccharothrix xinjiangensis TaxID=204798 RepID=UPI0031D0820C
MAGAGLLVGVTATPAAAAVEYSSIQAYGYSWCIDVPNGTTATVQLRTAACNGSQTQRWIFTVDSSGTWGELRNKATNRCMDIQNGSKEVGAVVRQHTCNGSGAQKFWFQNFFLRNKNSNLCPAMDNNYAPTGITQWGCGGFYLTAWVPNP